MKVQEMSQPGNELNVKCDWCELPSCYNLVVNRTGIRFYSCGKHKRVLDNTKDQLDRYKHLSKIR